MTSHKELWTAIENIKLDDADAQFPLTARLARDNGWNRDFAERVGAEYKRFVYLAVVSQTPLTPSDEVDQMWHLHMTYTRHYWGEFREAIGCELHHGPTKDGKKEDDRFSCQYEETLALYASEFGIAPPDDIWPSAEIRFGEAPFFARVNTRKNWVISKSLVKTALTKLTVLFALLSGVAISGYATAQDTTREPGQLTSYGIWVLALFGIVFSVFIVRLLRPRKNKAKKSAGGCGALGSGCGVVNRGKKSDSDSSSDSSGGSGCSSGCGGGGCGS